MSLPCLGFVEDHELPCDAFKITFVFCKYLIGCDKHVKRSLMPLMQLIVLQIFPKNLPILQRTPVGLRTKLGGKTFELVYPIRQRGRRSNHKEGTPYPFVFGEMSQERNSLDRFACKKDPCE